MPIPRNSSSTSISLSASAEESGATTPEIIDFDTRNYPVDPALIAPTIPLPTPAVNPPQATANMATTTTTTTVVTGPNGLPIKGQRGAPTTFTGRFDEIVTFLQHYERVCAQKQVTSDQDLIENLTQYCTRKVREFMEGLPSFKGGVWASFKKDLLKYFDAERDSGRYRISDLEKFVTDARNNKIKSLPTWKTFNRSYIRIAGWLTNHGKLPSRDKDLYFWKGINKDFRNQLALPLQVKHPDHDMQTPWKMTDVCEAAEVILQRGKFENDRLPSDTESETERFSSSDSETESSSSESDEDMIKKKSSKKRRSTRSSHKKRSKKTSHHSEEVAVIADKKAKIKKSAPPSTGTTKEVEELINKLNKMSLDDPDYAGLYLRAFQLNPAVKGILESLALQRRTAVPRPRPNDQSMPRFSNQNNRNFGPNNNTLGPQSGRCFGCGEPGHMTAQCPALLDLLNKGVIRRDPLSRRYVRASGEGIRRMDNETLIQAINRPSQIQSHFVQIADLPLEPVSLMTCHATIVDEQPEASEASSDEGSEAAYEDESEPEEIYTYEVIRTSPRDKKIKAHLENEPIKILRHGKRVAGPPIVEIPIKPRHATKPKAAPKKDKIPTPTPYEPPPPQAMAPPLKDIEMADAEVKPESKHKKDFSKHQALPQKEMTPSQPIRYHRQSELQSSVNMEEVLQQMLTTPVTMQWGKVIAIAPGVAQRFQTMLRPKRITVPQPELSTPQPMQNFVNMAITATAFKPHARGSLIYIPMRCGSQVIRAIIDTGSQLNIASGTAYDKFFADRYTRDISKQLIMNDANGGHGTLEGYIQDVELKAGAVDTYANIWIGQQVPFDLLLGRPWQRGNLVSIDERAQGTYLLFKGLQNGKLLNQFEIMITPEPVPKHMANFMQSLRSVNCNFASTAQLAIQDSASIGENSEANISQESFDSMPELESVHSSDYDIVEESRQESMPETPDNPTENISELAEINATVALAKTSDSVEKEELIVPDLQPIAKPLTLALEEIHAKEEDQSSKDTAEEVPDSDSDSAWSFTFESDSDSDSAYELGQPSYITHNPYSINHERIVVPWTTANLLSRVVPRLEFQEADTSVLGSAAHAENAQEASGADNSADPELYAYIDPESEHEDSDHESESASEPEDAAPQPDATQEPPATESIASVSKNDENQNQFDKPKKSATLHGEKYEVSTLTLRQIRDWSSYTRVTPYSDDFEQPNTEEPPNIGDTALLNILTREWRYQQWRRLQLKAVLAHRESRIALLTRRISALTRKVTYDLPAKYRMDVHSLSAPIHALSLGDCEVDPLGPRAPIAEGDHTKCLVHFVKSDPPPPSASRLRRSVIVNSVAIWNDPYVLTGKLEETDQFPPGFPSPVISDPTINVLGSPSPTEYLPASEPRAESLETDWLEAFLRQNSEKSVSSTTERHSDPLPSEKFEAGQPSSPIPSPALEELGSGLVETSAHETMSKSKKRRMRRSRHKNSKALTSIPSTDSTLVPPADLVSQIAGSVVGALRQELQNDRNNQPWRKNKRNRKQKNSPASRPAQPNNEASGRANAGTAPNPVAQSSVVSNVPPATQTNNKKRQGRKRRRRNNAPSAVPLEQHTPLKIEQDQPSFGRPGSFSSRPDTPYAKNNKTNENTHQNSPVKVEQPQPDLSQYDILRQVQNMISTALQDSGLAKQDSKLSSAPEHENKWNVRTELAQSTSFPTGKLMWHYRRELSPHGLDKALPDPLR